MVFRCICLKWSKWRAQPEVYDLWTVYQIWSYQSFQGQKHGTKWNALRISYLNKNEKAEHWIINQCIYNVSNWQVTELGDEFTTWYSHFPWLTDIYPHGCHEAIVASIQQDTIIPLNYSQNSHVEIVSYVFFLKILFVFHKHKMDIYWQLFLNWAERASN